MFMYTQVNMCVPIYMEVSGQPQVFLKNYPPCFLRLGLSLGPEACQ